MQFKKVLSSVLVVILLLSLTVFSASAAAASAFELAVEVTSTADDESSFIKAGETIEVKIAIPEGKNPGVAYMMFDVEYDAAALKLDTKSIATAIFTMGSPELNRGGIIIDEENGRIAFKTDMLAYTNTTETGAVVALSFKVNEGVCAKTEIAVSNLMAFNVSNDEVKSVAGAQELVIHDFDDGKKVDPTCTENGYVTYKCTKCDVSYEVVDESSALGHDFSKVSCTEDSACTRCKLAGDKAIGHNYSAWKVEKEAEPGVDGAKVRTCSNCGDKQTEVLSALPAEESGCGSTIALSALALVPMLGAAVVFGKKKSF